MKRRKVYALKKGFGPYSAGTQLLILRRFKFLRALYVQKRFAPHTRFALPYGHIIRRRSRIRTYPRP